MNHEKKSLQNGEKTEMTYLLDGKWVTRAEAFPTSGFLRHSRISPKIFCACVGAEKK